MSTNLKTIQSGADVEIRPPLPSDGPAVTRLIKDSPPLDLNSAYCNLLQCSHFAATSASAFSGDVLMGFVSGYRLPGRANTLFIWQVAVSEQARGLGLARAMLGDIVERSENRDLCWLETSITAANSASWAMFQGFARSRNAVVRRSVMFGRDEHFAGSHETEYLLRIGPLRRSVA